MSDPLNATSDATGLRPTSWVGFDEISMTTPAAEPRADSLDDNRRGSVAREESIEMDSGRDSVATEERIDIEDTERPVITPLPTNEMIADPSRLGQAPVVDAKQEYDGVIISNEAAIPKKKDDRLPNGKIITTIYPENSGCVWVVPPRYAPHSMPDALAAEGITIPREDIVTAMELLTNDYRFRSFSTIYSRLIAFWMALSIVILLIVLFSNTQRVFTTPTRFQGGLPVMFFCLFWVFMLFAGIIGCAIIRKQIRVGLRHCVQSANKILLKYNILCGVEDKGQLSCHKVVIHFMSFRVEDCVPDVERLIRIESSGGAVVYGGEAHAAPAKEMTKKEIREKALQLILKYSQGYVKDTVKHRVLFPTRPALGVSEYVPKHVAKQQCLCQYIDKKHFSRSPRKWYSRLV